VARKTKGGKHRLHTLKGSRQLPKFFMRAAGEFSFFGAPLIETNRSGSSNCKQEGKKSAAKNTMQIGYTPVRSCLMQGTIEFEKTDYTQVRSFQVGTYKGQALYVAEQRSIRAVRDHTNAQRRILL
jgi:hypothetical protein